MFKVPFPQKISSVRVGHSWGSSPLEILAASHRRMLPVLHLHPIGRPASTIGPIAPFADKPFQPELTHLPKQVRTNLARLKRRDEDAFWPPCKQPRQIGLAHR